MNKYLSEKLKVLSFFCILLVLYIHSGFHADEIENMPINFYVQNFISGAIGHCAVPLFFTISGYLFFLSVPNGLSSIFEKIKKRIKTLLIPYLFGTAFFIAFYIFIGAIPGAQKFINGSSDFFKHGILQFFISALYDTGNGTPLAFQLWFIRDLIIIVVFTPLIYFALKYLKWVWLLITFCLLNLNIPHFPALGLFWFSLGSLLVNTNMTIRKPKLGLALIIIFLSTCVAQSATPNKPEFWDYTESFSVFLGICSLWYFYDFIIPSNFNLENHQKLATFCSFTFFIYLFHEPTLNIVRKVIVAVVGKTSPGFLISYLLSPIIFIIAAVIIGKLIKKLIPKFYFLSTGGR